MNNEKWKELATELLKEMLKDRYDEIIRKSQEAKEKGDRYPYYDEYSWTKEEQEAFRKWAVERVRNVARVSKRYAEREVSYLIFNYGLKVR